MTPPFEQAAPPVAKHDIARQLPLHAIENRGQRDRRVAYYVEGRDTGVYLRSDGLTITLAGPGQAPEVAERWAVDLDFVGALGVGPVGVRQSSVAIHDLRGDPGRW